MDDDFFHRALKSQDTGTWLLLLMAALLMGALVGANASRRPRIRAEPGRPRVGNTPPAPRVRGRRGLTYQIPRGANDYGELE